MLQDQRAPLPAKKPVSLARARAGGALFLLMGVGLGYLFLWRPLLEARQTGMLHYSLKAVLFPPALVYTGLAVWVADLRDGTTRETGPDGEARFTRKGKLFLGGLVAVLLLSAGGWLLLLHLLGFREVQ